MAEFLTNRGGTFFSCQMTGHQALVDLLRQSQLDGARCARSAPRFNGKLPSGLDNVVEVDASVYGRVRLEAYKTLVTHAYLGTTFDELGIAVPPLGIEVGVLEAKKPCFEALAAFLEERGEVKAVARLRHFTSKCFAEGATIHREEDWVAWLEGQKADGVLADPGPLHRNHILQECFGVSPAIAQAVASGDSTGNVYRAVRWLNKFTFKPQGCYTDVVNYACLAQRAGYDGGGSSSSSGDGSGGRARYRPDADTAIEQIRRFNSILGKAHTDPAALDEIWVPGTLVHDCELDDLMLLGLLTAMHRLRGTKLAVVAQLPPGADDPIAFHQRFGRIIKDGGSKNLDEVLLWYGGVCQPKPPAPRPVWQEKLEACMRACLPPRP